MEFLPTFTKEQYMLSMDYELFFGENAGIVKNCLIKPTDLLAALLNKYNHKMVLFIDASMLVKYQEIAAISDKIANDLNLISAQLTRLVSEGHELQLHIHPHWHDTEYDLLEEQWVFNTKRFRLHDFDEDERFNLIKEAKSLLESIAGQSVTAFRAGGWCLQPYKSLTPMLERLGIKFDSSVYFGGYRKQATHYFDYRQCPISPSYYLPQSKLIEVPISSHVVSPTFFWRMLKNRKNTKKALKTLGDGKAISNSLKENITKLLKPTCMPVAIDGIKGVLLEEAYRKSPTNHLFNIMGHPKALTPMSFIYLENFIKAHSLKSVTFNNISLNKEKRESAVLKKLTPEVQV